MEDSVVQGAKRARVARWRVGETVGLRRLAPAKHQRKVAADVEHFCCIHWVCEKSSK